MAENKWLTEVFFSPCLQLVFFLGTDHGSLFPSHASHGEGRSQSSRFDGHDTLACGARTGASDSAYWVGWVGEYLEDHPI